MKRNNVIQSSKGMKMGLLIGEMAEENYSLIIAVSLIHDSFHI